MTEPWKTSAGKMVVIVLPDGNTKEVKCSAPFIETINAFAREAGLSKFSLVVDGEDIDRSDAPETFSDVCKVEIKKYDEGA